MVTERQRRANQANARKSTGPRSAAGKARAARNAVTHGLNTAPDADAVATWYGIIRDTPGAAPAPFSQDVTDTAALRLAVAEARRSRAATAEIGQLKRVTEKTRPKTLADMLDAPDLDLEDPQILEHLISCTTDPEEVKGLEILRDHYSVRALDDLQVLRRLTRYRRSSEAQCRKAFKAWLEVE